MKRAAGPVDGGLPVNPFDLTVADGQVGFGGECLEMVENATRIFFKIVNWGCSEFGRNERLADTIGALKAIPVVWESPDDVRP
jgi:hypothetical protein